MLDLYKISKQLMIKEPFHGMFLSGLNKQVSEVIPTAGVSKNNINYQLIINPNFWDTLKITEKEAILKHELLHIEYFHLESYSLNRYSNKELFNIAADLEINQYVEGLPDGALYLNMFFQDPAQHTFKGTKYYYDKLLKKEDMTEKGKDMLDKMMSQMQSGVSIVCSHESWKEFEGMDESEKKLMRQQLEHQIKEAIKGCNNRGTIPGHLTDLLNLKEEEPKFNWKAYLRRFCGGSNVIYTKKTRKKPNKRYTDNPALKIKTKSHILVGIDTSGSVSNEELIDFMGEIHHIWKCGVKITVAQCDSSIANIKEYNGNKHNGIEIHGRGGTTFDPVIHFYNDHKKDYTNLIYFTDGEAPAPPKPHKSMLWVLSRDRQYNDELPGFQININ